MSTRYQHENRLAIKSPRVQRKLWDKIRFSWGEQIDTTLVNFDGGYPYNKGDKSEDRDQTVAVKDLPANGWGLHQMHGNVWEWCQDKFADYPEGRVVDPLKLESGDSRVLRGGSWINIGSYCRSAYRSHYFPAERSYGTGFRLARGQ